MNDVYQLIEGLAESATQFSNLLQDPLLDSLVYSKKINLEKKLNQYDFSCFTKVYLGNHLKYAQPVSHGAEFVCLEADFFQSPPLDVPAGSVFILLNNDIGKMLPAYVDFYQKNPQALFVIWDWDSQHWLQMSALCAMHCDFYIPATSEINFTMSHFNSCILGPVFPCVHQWSRQYILNHLDVLLAERQNQPFGMHVHYEKYAKRNRVVASVMQHFPSVGFTNNDFKERSDLDNLQEWAAYKSHWIAPVLGGVPIRVYNALLTGGIPIVPRFYQNLPEVAYLGATPLYYDVNDLIEPQRIVQTAIDLFDASGEGGLIQRVSSGLANHHVDVRCNEILQRLQRAISTLLKQDHSFHDQYFRFNENGLGGV